MADTDRLKLIFHGGIVLLVGLLCGLPTAIEASTALVMGGVIGTSPFAPGGTPATYIAFLSAVVGILGAVVATAVTLIGVRAALDSRVAVPPN